MQTLTPEKVAQLAQAAGFTGAALDEQTRVINGRIAAALTWAKAKATPGSPEAIALTNLAAAKEYVAPTPPPKPQVGSAFGNEFLSGINTSGVDLDPMTAAIEKVDPTTVIGFGEVIDDKDEHAFAQQITANASTLALAAKKKWVTSWAAEKMAAILTHLTGKPHHVQDGAGSFTVAKTNEPPAVTTPPAEEAAPPASTSVLDAASLRPRSRRRRKPAERAAAANTSAVLPRGEPRAETPRV